MYDCEYYVVHYINYAKKAWNMSKEDYEKTPDIRAFCTLVTDEAKREVFSKAVKVTKAVREGVPPQIDIDEFTFNNYKEACGNDLTAEEVEELHQQVEMTKRSSLTKWKINNYAKAFEEIKAVRKGAE